MRRWWLMAGVLAAVAATMTGGPASATVTAVAQVYGWVGDPDTKAPTVGAQVHVYSPTADGSGMADEQWVMSAADGSFQVPLHVGAEYLVEIGAEESSPYALGTATAFGAQDSVTYCELYPVAAAPGGGAISAVSCSAPVVAVERFWSPRFNNAHFFTTGRAEAEHIATTDSNWQYEGTAFIAEAPMGETCPGGSPVYRFYSARFQSHFYTMNPSEKAQIIATDRNWNYEGVAYCAEPSAATSFVPLHRFWSPKFGKHFFTASQAEANQIIASDRNWNYEGIAYYVLPAD